MVVGLVTSALIASISSSGVPSRTNEFMNFVPSHTVVACSTPPTPPQESVSPHEPIPDNVHGDLGRASISSVQTMVQDDPIGHRLTSITQAFTSGRCEADPARLKEDLASAMKTKFGVDIGNSTLYQKPYLAEFDLISFPASWCVPDFVKFSGDEIKHIGSTLTNISYN